MLMELFFMFGLWATLSKLLYNNRKLMLLRSVLLLIKITNLENSDVWSQIKKIA